MFKHMFYFFLLMVFLTTAGLGQAVAAEVVTTTIKTPLLAAAQVKPGEPVEPAISREQALEIARSVFSEMLAGKDLQVELEEQNMEEARQVWRVSWHSRDPYPARRPEHVNILLDAQSGELLHADFWMDTGDPNQGAGLIGREEARAKAESFARKMRPAEFARTRLDDNQLSAYYEPPGVMKQVHNFYWKRVENGVGVEGDGITVGIDTLSGQVQHYSFQWHREAAFPAPGEVLESASLASRAVDSLGLYLGYGVSERAATGTQGLPEALLSYRLNGGSPLFFDPKTGEFMNGSGKRVPLEKAKRFSQLPVPVTGRAVLDPTRAPGERISEIEGLKAAQAFFQKLDANGKITRSGGGGGGYGTFREEYWGYSPVDDREQKGPPHRERSVMVDIFTGEVSQYSNYAFYRETSPVAGEKTITREQALKKARDFIKLAHPDRLEQVILSENGGWNEPKDVNGYQFQFSRLVNGLPFGTDGIDVAVDASSGEIRNYHCRWHKVYFPDPAPALKAEEAERLFLEKVPLELIYFFPWEKDRMSSTPVLAYRFAGPWEMGLDAVSGQLFFSDWMAARPVKEDRPAVPREHWAALPLALLGESGLLPDDEGLDPNGTVTRRDVVRVLMSALNRYYSSDGEGKAAFRDIGHGDRDFGAIQAAVRMGVLTGGGKFEPEGSLTRETLAAWLVRALGYEDVAGMPVRIELSFKDADLIDPSLRNHVAIAAGLNLMGGDENGFFRPQDRLTWAELAVVASKVAPRLRNRANPW